MVDSSASRDARATRVFVSGPDALSAPTADLVDALRAAGANVEHSPAASDDPRFHGWYEVGLAAATAWCEAFVIVPVTWWDSSTWMGVEADAGYRRALTEPEFQLCAWSPDGIEPRSVAIGMRSYLERAAPLPRDVRQAAVTVVAGTPARLPFNPRPPAT